MRVVFWDIETVSKSREELDALLPDDLKNPVMPYELANPELPNFEHKGMSDPEKLKQWREKKVADFHAEHRAKVQKWQAGVERDVFKFYSKAALSPTTCEVKLIGMRSVELNESKARQPKKPKEQVATVILCAEKIAPDIASKWGVVCFDSEAKMLAQFWKMVSDWRKYEGGFFLSGWNSNRFDLPTVRLRSAARRVRVTVPILGASGYPVRDLWTDLMTDFACGDRHAFNSIDEAARCLGLKIKSRNGSQFGELWETDKSAALAYLCEDDLRLTEEIGRLLLPCF